MSNIFKNVIIIYWIFCFGNKTRDAIIKASFCTNLNRLTVRSIQCFIVQGFELSPNCPRHDCPSNELHSGAGSRAKYNGKDWCCWLHGTATFILKWTSLKVFTCSANNVQCSKDRSFLMNKNENTCRPFMTLDEKNNSGIIYLLIVSKEQV